MIPEAYRRPLIMYSIIRVNFSVALMKRKSLSYGSLGVESAWLQSSVYYCQARTNNFSREGGGEAVYNLCLILITVLWKLYHKNTACECIYVHINISTCSIIRMQAESFKMLEIITSKNMCFLISILEDGGRRLQLGHPICVRPCFVYVHLYVFICICSFVCVHLYMFICICSFVCVHLYMFICMCSFVCVHLYMFICICSFVCVHLYVFIQHI
jgi:hypothetical protein